MKKNIFKGLILASTIASMPVNVMAKATAVVNFTSEDKVAVGDTIKVYMNVDNIEGTYDGVVSFGGKLTFDEEKLEYISAKNLDTPYSFEIYAKTMMLAGLDFTLENGMYNKTNIYEFTFKAKEVGNTEVTLNEAVLTDSKDYITSTVNAKNIEIVEPTAKTENREENEPVLKSENIIVKKNAEPNKKKMQKVNHYVHHMLKKLSNLMK